MKRKAVLLVLLGSLLTSCVVAVVAGAATGLMVYDRRSVNMIERDARIFHVVHTAIVTNPQFKQSHVVVSVFNQVVLLAGQTPIASLRVVAEKVAQSTPYVRRVYNEITVDQPSLLTSRSKDTWITGEVRARLMTKKGLESGSIRVVTENEVVYLMGIVTLEQANLAVSVARQINEVRKVVKVFQYIH
jgi:osmotically-inducible protein OsmY